MHFIWKIFLSSVAGNTNITASFILVIDLHFVPINGVYKKVSFLKLLHMLFFIWKNKRMWKILTTLAIITAQVFNLTKNATPPFSEFECL